MSTNMNLPTAHGYAAAWVTFTYSSFVHANISWSFGAIERFFVTPRFHHWYPGIEKEAIDVNFTIHFPLYDWLFGTYHVPEKTWPSGHGVSGHPVLSGYGAQFLYPFRFMFKNVSARKLTAMSSQSASRSGTTQSQGSLLGQRCFVECVEALSGRIAFSTASPSSTHPDKSPSA